VSANNCGPVTAGSKSKNQQHLVTLLLFEHHDTTGNVSKDELKEVLVSEAQLLGKGR